MCRKALCGSMLTNSSSLELVHIEERIGRGGVGVAWARLSDGNGEGQWCPQGGPRKGPRCFSSLLPPPATSAESGDVAEWGSTWL